MQNQSKLFTVLFSFLIFQIFFQYSYAEDPILISVSPSMGQVIFDGKWTDSFEWKQSSYNRLSFNDDSVIHLRTAHQENFIYIQINFESDKNIDQGYDSAMVCFDTKNDKTIIPQSDDYCFSTILDLEKSSTYQGNNNSSIANSFSQIPNHKNFVAIGTASDKYDRYNQIPHTSYEFKIPLDVLKRSDNYGFFISVFDNHTQNHYLWPYSIENSNSFSSPSQWGDLVSPDKSLPEFNSSILFSILILVMVIPIMITKLNLFKITIFRY